MGQFALDIAAFVAKVRDRADLVVRKIAIDMTTRIVERSPVGNPELWAANAQAALQRSQHNAVVDQINANLMSNPLNVTAKGNLKRRVRSQFNRKLSESQLSKQYPFAQGKGYVGGRFKGNWRVSFGAANDTPLDRIDAGGAETIAAAQAALSGFQAGMTIFMTNPLPYGPRLEYEAWSKQAPAGMVRITVAEFQQMVSQAVSELPP